MNCCNDYGNCQQGKDCPVRKQLLKENKPAENIVGVLLVMFVIFCVFALTFITVYK